MDSTNQNSTMPPQTTGSNTGIMDLTQQEQHDFRRYVGYGVLTVLSGGVLTAGVWAARKAWKNYQVTQEEKHQFDENHPSHFAGRLHEAINYWAGTDEESIRKTLTELPSYDFWLRVKESYSRRFGNSLDTELREDLSPSENAEMTAIINSKKNSLEAGGAVTPEILLAWAKRIQAAFDLKYWDVFGGTDTEAIYKVIRELPSKAVWEALKIKYQQWQGFPLDNVIEDELYWYEQNEINEILAFKP